MGFDLHMAPADGFRDWSIDEWRSFIESEPAPESERLGNGATVSWALAAVERNVRAPTPRLLRFGGNDDGLFGWYRDELPDLLRELSVVREGLASIPISARSLGHETSEELQRRLAAFRRHHSTRPAVTAFDLNFYFFETLDRFCSRALATGHGVAVSF